MNTIQTFLDSLEQKNPFVMNSKQYSNYKKTIALPQSKPRLLLHSCCGPCSTSVIERLVDFFDITVIYYNPNIYPDEEYIKRQNEQEKFLTQHFAKIPLIKCDWDAEVFENAVKTLQSEPEGGKRCQVCFALRLNKTAQIAASGGFDIFATTLSVSPHKNSQLINELGQSIAKQTGTRYLVADFKKQNGYLNSIKLSKEYDLYRQDYCGCKYSMQQKNNLDI